MEQWTFCT
uniref:Uncharacterized protein n=1 Tax=Arundo donax TaxID=35708 RepID=A0A0A8ZBU9_ARUDO